MRLTVGAKLCLMIVAFSAALRANSGTLAAAPNPPVRRTGAQVDGGLNCTQCHAPGANLAGGSVTITAANYTPGVPQTIRVALAHPEGQRWGFQLTARLASDESKPAGTFTRNDNVQIKCDSTTAIRGTDPPCNGATEFVMHTAASTRPGTPNGVTWEVSWTPPSSNVGDVVFYAAGNAANSSSSNAGDRIYTTRAAVSAAPAGPPAISQNGVVNAAGSAAPSSTVAPGTFFSIFGTNLAPGVSSWDSAFTGNRAPTALNGVSVKVNNKDAFVAYISPTQINAVAPDDTAAGNVTVQVTTPQGNTTATAVAGPVSPAFFTYFDTAANKFYVALGDTNARQAGQEIALYANGLGPVTGLTIGQIPSTAAQMTTRPTVTVGGQPATVTFAGINGFVGVYQVNIQIPAGLRGDQEIRITANGVQSPTNVFLKLTN